MNNFSIYDILKEDADIKKSTMSNLKKFYEHMYKWYYTVYYQDRDWMDSIFDYINDNKTEKCINNRNYTKYIISNIEKIRQSGLEDALKELDKRNYLDSKFKYNIDTDEVLKYFSTFESTIDKKLVFTFLRNNIKYYDAKYWLDNKEDTEYNK